MKPLILSIFYELIQIQSSAIANELTFGFESYNFHRIIKCITGKNYAVQKFLILSQITMG